MAKIPNFNAGPDALTNFIPQRNRIALRLIKLNDQVFYDSARRWFEENLLSGLNRCFAHAFHLAVDPNTTGVADSPKTTKIPE